VLSFASPPAARTGSPNRHVSGRRRSIARRSGRAELAEDFAIAIVDEAERGKHINERFTVGY
jgi:hypothetical protein